ncbi:branched-chain amino acid aminotransferase [Holophaga foetida]|uniref:branched-chain amino acid aminotransferase n=1 Tax=Holophaga foetida TaxID=35839 RepID=UPI0002472ECB|nr:branched-chain amino acid aminotransferase [Holophaga foetida]
MNADLTSSLFDIQLVSTRLSDEERQRRMVAPGFGKTFSEHMIVIPYREGEGWLRGQLKPYGPISMSPAANVLHYGQSVFEGFKGYRQPDGGVKSFRPICNAKRFNTSAHRLAMPEIPEDLFCAAADLLATVDQAWIPEALDPEKLHDKSFYFRPFMIGQGEYLGVGSASECLFMIIGGPAGSYFSGGIHPVTIWVEEEYVRASPGGTGQAKCGGNYAASLLPGNLAKAKGCEQVLYLDAIHRQYLEELGGMNVFLVLEEGGRTVIATPEKTGTILEGVTRESLITLAKELGYELCERRISIDEVETAHREGRLKEAFACGTAAVISPIGTFKSRRGDWVVNGNQLGPISMELRGALLDIQYGLKPDTHGWMHRIV